MSKLIDRDKIIKWLKKDIRYQKKLARAYAKEGEPVLYHLVNNYSDYASILLDQIERGDYDSK